MLLRPPTPLQSQMMLLGVGSSGGGSFNPSTLSALTEWFSIDSLAAVGNGNEASSWVGEAGLYTVTGAGGARPIYHAADTDGMPILTFDGVDDVLTTTIDNHTLFSASGDFEIWVVVKGVMGANLGIISCSGLTQGIAILGQSTPRILFYAPGATPAISGSADVIDNAWHLLRCVRSGGDHSFYLDGVFINTHTTGAGTWQSGPDVLWIGYDGGGNHLFGGLRDMFFFEGGLSAGDATALTNWIFDNRISPP